MKDIRAMNVSLLAKWRWRLLVGEEALWKDVLVAKYGVSVGELVTGRSSGVPRWAFLWWKELIKLGDFGELNWFNSALERKVGNGLHSSFWNDTWKRERSFRKKYPRLYLISDQKEAKVGEVGVESELGMEWNFI